MARKPKGCRPMAWVESWWVILVALIGVVLLLCNQAGVFA